MFLVTVFSYLIYLSGSVKRTNSLIVTCLFIWQFIITITNQSDVPILKTVLTRHQIYTKSRSTQSKRGIPEIISPINQNLPKEWYRESLVHSNINHSRETIIRRIPYKFYVHKHLVHGCQPLKKPREGQNLLSKKIKWSASSTSIPLLQFVTPPVRYDDDNVTVRFIHTTVSNRIENTTDRYVGKEEDFSTLFSGLEVASQVRERSTVSPYVYSMYPPVGTIGPYGDKFFKDFNKDSNVSRER